MIKDWRFGLAVAGIMTLTVTATAFGQVPVKPKTDTSTTRIKLSKEQVSGGEVALPVTAAVNKDSIDREIAAAVQAREAAIRADQRLIDSVVAAARMREAANAARLQVTSALAAARAAAAARADSIAQAEKLALGRKLARGLNFGVAGGASLPQRAIRNGYTGGWNVTVPLGWDASDIPLGIRGDFAVDHMNGTRLHNAQETTVGLSGDMTVWSLNLDMKLRMHAPGTTRTHLYAIGGLGAHRVVDGVYGTSGPNAGTNLDFSDAKTKLGWNAGVGAAIGWGRTELFIESRYIDVKSDMPYHLNSGVGTYTTFTPIIVGLQWF
jgi:opacity protein-like surface antigen